MIRGTQAVPVQTNCDQCGCVTTSSNEVVLAVYEELREATYAFTCPRCERVQCRRAGRQVIDLLAPVVGVLVWTKPPELLEEHDGPPITLDDVLAFCNRLYGRTKG